MGQCIALAPTPPPESEIISPITHMSVDVLYVDKDARRCQTLRTMLERHTISVACCGSGGRALQWMTKQTYNSARVVLIHQSIPDMGIATLAHRIVDLAPGVHVCGILSESNDALVSACIRSRMHTLFANSFLPGPLLTYIVDYILTIREPSQMYLTQLCFYTGKIWT